MSPWPLSSVGKVLDFFGEGSGFESRDGVFLFLKLDLGFLAQNQQMSRSELKFVGCLEFEGN